MLWRTLKDFWSSPTFTVWKADSERDRLNSGSHRELWLERRPSESQLTETWLVVFCL